MKKYLLSALALPLLFACSSEDYLDQKATDNDQFAGIEKVDATFSMADSPSMRMATKWGNEAGDRWGFAWLGDGTIIPLTGTNAGKAYQNHPLNQVSENGENYFKPETSIYVGKYYLYRPYDETVVDIEAIHFNSLEKQTISDATTDMESEAWDKAWNALASTVINIGDKFTNVSTTGTVIDGKTWDKPGIGERYYLYGAIFSNQTALDLTYQNNNPTFGAATPISGATDINYTIAAGEDVGAADIYSGTVNLTGAAKSFTYAPDQEPNNAAPHDAKFWANKKDLNGTISGTPIAHTAGGGAFTWNAGAITLNSPDADKNGVLDGISTGKEGNEGFFWFNSLPVTDGNATNTTHVVTTLETSYGVVTLDKEIKDCAYAHASYDGTSKAEWIKLSDVASTTAPKAWNFDGSQETFINHYGNHKGKFALDVNFSKGVMSGMHIKDDKHLQKALKYYIASGKDENVVLNLDQASATDNTFKISKISIALIQTIQAAGKNVKVKACTDHGTPKIIVTQDGQDKLGLADAKEVPALDKVFATATDVYLSKDCQWTWSGGGAEADYKKVLAIDDKVKSITNEGTLTVNAVNVEMTTVSPAATLANAKEATMTFNKVTTVKNALTNLGTINVEKVAELRAYGVAITNDATDASDKEQKGLINNSGVVGVTAGTSGKFYNYGIIEMTDPDAMTLLTSNEIGTKPFANTFGASNKMGTVVLPEGKPYAIVSVSNTAENGFIKYNWTAETYTHDTGNVKYNTIVVNKNITFTGDPATEIQYIEFDGTKTQVVNPGPAGSKGLLTELKGIIVNAGKSIIIEKTNTVNCSVSSWIAPGATIYKGGYFNGQSFKSIFGTWSSEQVVAYD